MAKYITMPLEEYEGLLAQIDELTKRKDRPMPDIDDITFLTPRLYGHLNRQKIYNIAQLESTTVAFWTGLQGFGRKSWTELKNLMKLYGLHFKS